MRREANYPKGLLRIFAMTIVLGLLLLSLSGCAPAADLWNSLRGLLGGQTDSTTPQQTDETSNPTDPSESVTDPGTTPTTEEPEGEEFVKIARKLDPLLWEVGEKLYYIDRNTNTLRYRYDRKDEDSGEILEVITETLTDQVSAVIGFSQERIFCLSEAMQDEQGRFVYDAVAVGYDGTNRETVAYQINNGAVIDDMWLVVSRYTDPLQILILDLAGQEEHVIFEDDGNLYPGMTQTDYALECQFEPMSDGIRIEVAYPGYSEFAYMRYLLLRDGAIAEDSKITPWQDNLGEKLFEQGIFQELQRIKTYEDLVIYVQTATPMETLLVCDHPDWSKTLIEGSEYYVMDFFYHEGRILVPVFWPGASASQSTNQVMLYDPDRDQTSFLENRYERYFQFEQTLAAIRVERISEETTNNVTGRLLIEAIDGSGRPAGTLFDQILTTGSVYGDFYYKAWQAGHDLVIYYESHQPDVGEITSTSSQWIFLNMRN